MLLIGIRIVLSYFAYTAKLSRACGTGLGRIAARRRWLVCFYLVEPKGKAIPIQ
jgi:hypothetical protein